MSVLYLFVLAFGSLLNGYPADRDQIDSLIRKLESEAKQIESPVRRQSAQLDLLRLRARSGESVPCKQVRQLGAGPDITRAIMENASAAVAQGKSEEAEALIDCAITAVHDVTESNTASIALHDVGIRLAALHRWKQAKLIAGQISNPFWRCETLVELARLENQFGLRDDALQAISEATITANAPTNSSLLMQSEELSEIGRLQESMGLRQESTQSFDMAINAALRMPEALARVEALLDIARQQIAAGQSKDDASGLAKALAEFDSQSDPTTKSSIAGRISETYARVSDITSSQHYLAVTASGFYYDVACSELARAYALNQDFSKSLALRSKIEDEGSQGYLLRDIAALQATSGKFDDAYRSVRLISRDYIRAEALRKVNNLRVTAQPSEALDAEAIAESEKDVYVRFYGLVGIADSLLH